jgi:alpha-N-arabinofuranosidase
VNGGVEISKKPIWIEGPHVFKRAGTYYLIAAEGGTAEDHSEVVFRSTSPRGPWEPYRANPILTQRHLDPARKNPVTSTGHASFVQTPKGEWWAVFLGTRPYQGNFYNTGRETFMLPVQWRDGWPHILSGNETVPFAHSRPDLPLQSSAVAFKNGNFTLRDDFSGGTLPLHWTFIRTVREPWYDLGTRTGWLTIKGRPAHIGKRTQPSFIGRRQQHSHFSAVTAMQFTPAHADDRAGLVAFQNDDFYYLLAVALKDGKPVIVLEKGSERPAESEVIAAAPITNAPGGTVQLRIEGRGALYDFSYAVTPGQWKMLAAGVDAAYLSTKTAGGYVGTMIGMYVYASPR